ncbi:MAG: EAL domain-containing protein [Burkholderiaceae bacterium]|nr:EAL domain-containing protein [Burkholderiaceae bacterium]
MGLIMVIARLQPDQLLKPDWRTQIVMGLTGGGATAVVMAALNLNAPGADLILYPVVTAFLAVSFRPLSALVCAALALVPLLGIDSAPWLATGLMLVGSMALGGLWKWIEDRGRVSSWITAWGMALTLPLAASASFAAATPAIEQSTLPGQWLALWPLQWWFWVSLSSLILGAARQFLLERATAALALAAANTALQENERKSQLALKALGGGRWEWDLVHHTLSCEGSFYDIFDIATPTTPAPGELPANTLSRWDRWYALRHPADARRTDSQMIRLKSGLEDNDEAEYRVRDIHGNWRWIMTRGTVARRDAQGKPVVLTGLHIDITAHHEAQEALQAAEAKYTIFYQTLPDPAGITRISDGKYIDVNATFCRNLGLELDQVLGRTSIELGVWAHDDERRKLVEAMQRDGFVERLPLRTVNKGIELSGLMSARSVQVNGESCLVFVYHDISEIQRKSDEVRVLYNQLQQAGRLARLGAWEDNLHGGLVYWSEVCFQVHGLDPALPPPSDYINTHVAPAYRSALRGNLRRSVREQAKWSMELEVLHADGHLFWIRGSGEPVIENGRVVRVRGVLQDIDEAKRAEQRLMQSEERFSRIFHLMPYPMGLTRQSDGVYVDLNTAWVDMMGIPREQAIGRSAIALGILSTEQRKQLVDETLRNGQLVDYEVTVQRREGSPCIVLQSMRATEFDGEPCWLFSLHDITYRKRDEEQVREREALLSLTLSAAHLGRWDWDLHTGMVTGDSRWHQMHELVSSTPASPEPVSWTQVITAQNADSIEQELERHIKQPDTPFDATWQVNLPGAAPRWVRNLGRTVGFNDQGDAQRMLGVSIDVTHQREQEALLHRLAHYDALTGLPNRVLLAKKLKKAMEQAASNNTLLGVAYMDLDDFKPVNDRLGHSAGDRLLVKIAQRLTRALRPADCVARLGGDEFVLLMPGLSTEDECQQLLGRVMRTVAAPCELGADRASVTASIGYTMFPQDDADADTLLRHADHAMYVAKQGGRNRFHQFDATHEKAVQRLQAQGQTLRSALDQGQFLLYFQPKVDMHDGVVKGAEALARWQHPDRGVVGPGEFMPLLEGTDLDIDFGQWVVNTALQVLEGLQGIAPPLPISINISAHHLQQPDFAAWMAQCLADHPRAPAHLVEIEITESAALYDLLAVTATLEALRTLGITVSLDDFGTGYSSLTYLRRLPMDTLKIDQSFVRGMMTDPGDLAIVQGVIGLARSFGYHVIAEGVETIEQGKMLLQLGCPDAQGYCIAKPMPLDAFIAWIPTWKSPIQWRDS